MSDRKKSRKDYFRVSVTTVRKKMVLVIVIFLLGISGNVYSDDSYKYSYEEEKRIAEEVKKLNQVQLDIPIEDVIQKLSSDDENIRLSAVELLGRVQNAQQISAIEELLLKDPSATVRAECATSLALLDSVNSKSVLIKALNDPDEKVILESALALAILGEKEECLKILANFWTQGDRKQKLACHLGLRDIATGDASEILHRAINDNDPYVAVDAAIILAQLGYADDAFPTLQELSDHEAMYVRLAVLRGLAVIGDEKCLNIVHQFLTDEEPLVSKRSQKILQDFGKEFTIKESRTRRSSSYNPDAAAQYADTWWNSRNPAYNDYSSSGGDCANFVSQCLIAGGLDLSAGTNGSGANVQPHDVIVFCDYLHTHLKNYQDVTYERRYSTSSPREPLWFVKGDPAMYGNSTDPWKHAVFAVIGDDNNNAALNAHSVDVYHKSVQWFYDVEPTWTSCDFYHINTGGGSLDTPTLLSPSNGSSVPSETPKLDWSAVSGATSYRVFVSESSTCLGSLSNTDKDCACGCIVNETTSLDYFYVLDSHGLEPGTTYYWMVRAGNATAGSPNSSIWNFKTPTVLDTPTLLSPSNGSTVPSETPKLDWSAVSGATVYRVFVSDSYSCLDSLKNDDKTCGCGCIINETTSLNYFNILSSHGLEPGTIYYWMVRAGNATDGSPNSSIWSFQTPAAGASDLVPYQRSGWDNKIVISNTTDTTDSASTIYDDENIYVDYCCANIGNGDAGSFYYGLYIDGILKKYVQKSSLPSGYNSAVLDSSIGTLSSGPHTFEIRCDYNKQVTESNESNNNHPRIYTITPRESPPQITLTPGSYSFGNQNINTESSAYSFTLKNTGGGTATGTVSLTGTNADQFLISSGSGDFSLTSNQTKTIQVKFRPASEGNKTAVLTADGTSPCNDASASLSGTGVNNCTGQPDWSVNSADFRNKCSLTGIVYGESDQLLEGSCDLLAAFVGDECRGVAEPVMTDLGVRYFLQVWSNATSGETITFRYFDSAGGTTYEDVCDPVEFVANTSYGSIASPKELSVVCTKTVELNLTSGWNWISINVSGDDMSLGTVLASLGSSAVQIDSQNGYAEYSGGKWYGSLSEINPASMYMIKMASPGTLTFTGYPLDISTPINLTAGWNWIGYYPDFSLSPENALVSLNGKGIQIDSQNGYAEYSGGKWYGSLSLLEPAKGYMLKMETAGQLIYPASPQGRSQMRTESDSAMDEKQTRNADPGWKENDISAYKERCNITAKVYLDQSDIVGQGDMLAGFVDGELRSGGDSVAATDLPGGLGFSLQVWGDDADDGRTMTFKYYDASEDRVYDISENVQFVINGQYGNVAAPENLTLLFNPPVPGDVDHLEGVNLKDAVLALKVITGINNDEIFADADVNGDGKIGIEEAIYILQIVGELRKQ